MTWWRGDHEVKMAMSEIYYELMQGLEQMPKSREVFDCMLEAYYFEREGL